MQLTANVIGATGLVGKQLVKLLLDDDRFDKVRIFVRRNSELEHHKLEQVIVDFKKEQSWQDLLRGDVLFSTLGTTLKQAGGQKNQYKVDFTYNYNFAKTARKNGINSYILVSSMSANSKSKLFYSRMKGELDDAVSELGFKHLSIIRPGPLTGNREVKRLGEVIAFPIITFLTKFALKKYRPIKDSIVAQAMINRVFDASSDKTIWEGEEVFELAELK